MIRSVSLLLLYILILHQTTTGSGSGHIEFELLYILILHQTTTSRHGCCFEVSCFISWFYIKPQQFCLQRAVCFCCFISWFYIKPQQCSPSLRNIKVALYLDSTSNHNKSTYSLNRIMLLYILILHQTTTSTAWVVLPLSCFISWFYIKPQLELKSDWNDNSCFISWFYIKPQPSWSTTMTCDGCFISWFYIKPQHTTPSIFLPSVALYLDSTSNHNYYVRKFYNDTVALYLDSTSNHNRHNAPYILARLLYILILHQTTTFTVGMYAAGGCFISWFYIKPQP